MLNFSIRITVLSAVMAALLYALWWLNPSYLHVHAFYIQLTAFLLTLLTFWLTMKTLNTEQFSNGVMGGMSIRLFTALGGIMAYLYFVNHEPILFALTAFGIYFSYLCFEIVSLLAILRRNSSNTGQ